MKKLLYISLILIITSCYPPHDLFHNDTVWVSKENFRLIDTTSFLNDKMQREPIILTYDFVTFLKLFRDGYYKEYNCAITKSFNDSAYVIVHTMGYSVYSGDWTRTRDKIIIHKYLKEEMYYAKKVSNSPDQDTGKTFTDTLLISSVNKDYELEDRDKNYIISQYILQKEDSIEVNNKKR